MVIITVVTLVLGAITKTFIDAIPNRFIPLQNLIIGIVSAVICIVAGIETNVLQAFVLCLLSTLGANGIVELTKINKE
jgi:hypothetical protein